MQWRCRALTVQGFLLFAIFGVCSWRVCYLLQCIFEARTCEKQIRTERNLLQGGTCLAINVSICHKQIWLQQNADQDMWVAKNVHCWTTCSARTESAITILSPTFALHMVLHMVQLYNTSQSACVNILSSPFHELWRRRDSSFCATSSHHLPLLAKPPVFGQVFSLSSEKSFCCRRECSHVRIL